MIADTSPEFTYHVVRRVRSTKEAKPSAPVSTNLYKIGRRGRFWEIVDAQGDLVCLTAYKKGAVEVVRRLTTMQVVVAK